MEKQPQTSNEWYDHFCKQLQDISDNLDKNRHTLKQTEVEDLLHRATQINRQLEMIARDFK